MLLRTLTCLAAVLPLLAQAPEYSIRVWRTQDGLPQNRIPAIAQTPDGYLWLGTPAGLARFDGLQFEVFDRTNTAALAEDSILSLCVGKQGALWIGTEGRGLVQLQGGRFTAFGVKDGLANGFVRALHEDGGGTLWIGTDRGYFKRSHDGLIHRLDSTGTIPVLAIRTIHGDREGRILTSSNHGIYVTAEDSPLQRYAPAGLPSDFGIGLLTSADGSFWLGSRDGLWQFRNGTATRHAYPGQGNARVMRQGHDGGVWVGTVGGGLLQLTAAAGIRPVAAPALPDQTVLSIFEDRDMSLWVGTQDGLVRMTRTTIRTVAARNGLATDNVSSVYEDRDGSILIGTITAQMSRLTAAGKVEPFVMPPGAEAFRPRTAYRDRRGALWLGSSLDGLARITPAGVALFSRRQGLRDSSVRQMMEDRQGHLWIALGSGLSRWDGRKFHNYYLEDGLAYGSVRALMQERGGDLLVGTDGGANRIRGTHFVEDSSLAPLSGVKVWTIIEDPAHGVWFGTRGGGLYRLRDGVMSRLTTRDGLASNNIYQLLDDQTGNLWMSTSTGVASVAWDEANRAADGKTESLTVSSYGMAEGLESTEMNGGMHPAGLRTKSGDLWFASVKGAVRIRPGLPRPPRQSTVTIESLRADDELLPLTSELSIPRGRRKLVISFTACDLLAGDRTSLRYRLDGFDSQWSHDAQRRTAVYTNLPPGSYRFRVAVLGANLPEASMRLVMLPHFYQTAWFFGLCGLVGGLAVWGAFRFYGRQTKARYAMLLAERTRLAREMHDTVIQGCVGVSTLLEAEASTRSASGGSAEGQEQSQSLLDHARKQVRLTLDEARQAVWDLRHTDLDGNLATSLRDFAGRFSSESAIPIGVEVSGESARLEGRAERNLLLVAREAIRNALTHASPGRIDLRLRFDPAEVCLEVRDDGRGFDLNPQQQEGHYGIVGMRERVEQLGGSFRLSSTPGHGTLLLARLPVRGPAK